MLMLYFQFDRGPSELFDASPLMVGVSLGGPQKISLGDPQKQKHDATREQVGGMGGGCYKGTT